MHGVKGGAVAAAAGILAFTPPESELLLPLALLVIAYWFVVGAYFLAYEITEGWRIRDWAYRDIGGYMIGFTIVAGAVLPLLVWRWN